MPASTPLLCELHAHTTWSDGALTVRELVDLYGGSGFDVLAITDHDVRQGHAHASAIGAATHKQYLDEVEAEGERALGLYGLLVVPGLELTYDDPDPRLAALALALGVRRFIGLERGLDAALADAAGAGAALIGAHPYTLAGTRTAQRTTARLGGSPSGRQRSSTASSFATGTTSSIGSPAPDCRQSRTATSIDPSTWPPGRPSSRRSEPRRRSFPICARATQSR